ncbi:hexokinase type 2-like [Littorina saxatilis]|uniref:hexokinase type 2-like n=1 Tax=Littorina saxatilis TaxID=31220 RepID=UPI0038B64ADE
MTSVLYIGEMVRLELVQQMEKGQIFASCPRLSSKLGYEGRISADDVSLIESDTNGYLITKHLLKKLDMEDHYTEGDCQAVRSVCKAVTKRAADLAAAGLATLINHLDDPDITVAIEGRLKEYYPGFLNQMEKRTRELVKPHLQFEIVRSQEGSSTGAALLAAAVFPSFPKMAPNKVTSGH